MPVSPEMIHLRSELGECNSEIWEHRNKCWITIFGGTLMRGFWTSSSMYWFYRILCHLKLLIGVSLLGFFIFLNVVIITCLLSGGFLAFLSIHLSSGVILLVNFLCKFWIFVCVLGFFWPFRWACLSHLLSWSCLWLEVSLMAFMWLDLH